MPIRKVPLVQNEIYHICSKSIAEFKIFNYDKDYKRMLDEMNYYLIEEPPCQFSLFQKLKDKLKLKCNYTKRIVEILAYCIMPTHIHLLLRQIKENGISEYMKLILNSYSIYFNLKHNRKGALWESRFKNILVETDEQLLHLTRYIHLNPVTASLVNRPEDWKYSSYHQYLNLAKINNNTCSFSKYINITSEHYKEFVNNHIDYQKKLALIKHLVLE